MARNRKRRSDRRPRRPSDDANSPPNVATARTARREEPEETQDPLEHAAPDVELAEAQLAVGRPELADDAADAEPDDAQDAELSDDELDGGGFGGDGGRRLRSAAAVGVARAPAGAAVGWFPARRRAPSPHVRARLVGFIQGSWRELQRVQWPDRRQVMQATGVVIGFVIVAGVFLGVADFIATKVVNLILK